MVEIRSISPEHDLYKQACDLRERVLLRAVGFTYERYRTEYAGVEDGSEHFVAVLDHPTGPRVVGTALLWPDHGSDGPAEGIGKVMQVAVDPQLQGTGVGRRLMAAVEARAFGELGLHRVMCHAQLTAVPFYTRLGWHIEGDEFTEAGIPHRKMAVEAEQPGQRPLVEPARHASGSAEGDGTDR